MVSRYIASCRISYGKTMTCLSFVANPILVGGNAFVKRLETFFGKFEFNPYLKETKLGVARGLFEP